MYDNHNTDRDLQYKQDLALNKDQRGWQRIILEWKDLMQQNKQSN